MSFLFRQPFAYVARLTCWIAVCAGVGGAVPGLAGADIGQATQINQSVTGSYSSKAFSVSAGDRVKLSEVVRTNTSGEARLDFEEGTDLVIFSASSIIMQHFTSASVVMSAGDGTFAFNTGRLSPGSYRIVTSAGTLTPHGTRFTFSVRGVGSRSMFKGAVTFCPRGKSRAYCVDATPGRSIVGQAGQPAQVVGYGGPPPAIPPVRTATVYTQQTNYPPAPPCAYGATRSFAGDWHRCPVVSPPNNERGGRGGSGGGSNSVHVMAQGPIGHVPGFVGFPARGIPRGLLARKSP